MNHLNFILQFTFKVPLESAQNVHLYKLKLVYSLTILRILPNCNANSRKNESCSLNLKWIPVVDRLLDV
ncbi:hypothetical protein KC19_8G070100 [Ceratodon purpureus]|uniref:Uncharacterized protein n=1 Tax=Ceratodon purpureus TaxID=3225 RepID=A0A8T0GZQ7_CERPU|nr:hypothetical protein KC19_8G070100 [Ceratodon purpureus]